MKKDQVATRKPIPGIDRDDSAEARRARIVSAIRALPRAKVSTYGGIARAAGWAGAARQVVRILRQVSGLPWHRVLGAGGAIKLPGENGEEQRFRLRMEGVAFRGARVDMGKHEFYSPKKKESKQAGAKAKKRKR
jgi:methylated-DNA-protein-cysteine methyltransferase related protein